MSKDDPSGNSSARALAWQALITCLSDGAPAQEALHAVLSPCDLASRDRNLATELVYGYCRFKGRMDYLVRHFLKQPERTPDDLFLLLGMGAYELVFTRIPAYATLSTYVDLVKNSRRSSMAKMVNAILRRIADLAADAMGKDLYVSLAKTKHHANAAWYSLPPWLYDFLRKQCGYDEPQHFEALLEQPPLGVRINSTHAMHNELLQELNSTSNLIAQTGPMFCLQPGSLEQVDSLLRKGKISLQGYGSYEALFALDPHVWEYPLWEACCGRGNKTCALLESRLSLFWASDPHMGRLRGLAFEIRRLGLPRPLIFAAAAEEPLPLKQSPRTIFLDVPCSGLGVLTRRPDIKWKLRKAQVREFISLQQRIVDRAIMSLPSGGLMVYMTCTVNPQENELQMERLEEQGAGSIEMMNMTPWDAPWRERLFGALVRKK